MHVFIPTYGRANRQHTFNNLPDSVKNRTILVVQDREKHLYEDYEHLVLPKNIKTISPARQWIMEYANDVGWKKICMLDDDLRFDKRRKDDSTKFIVAPPLAVTGMFKAIEHELSDFAHVGVLAREGGNRVPYSKVACTRMMRVLAYDVEIYMSENIKFDRLPLQEDFDVTLQLLRKGYANSVLCEWVQGQGSSNADGGCSHFRTIELHNKNAEKLAKLHAPFVKVVEKQTKNAWNGQPRLDVRIQWKKAFNDALKSFI